METEDRMKALLEQKHSIEKELEELSLQRRAAVVNEYRLGIRLHGLTVHDLFPDMPKNTVAIKYRDPETGKTWAGRGKLPNWLVGKNKDDYKVM